MDLDYRKVILETLCQVFELVEEQAFDFSGYDSRTRNNEITTAKIPVLTENIERVWVDNCFHDSPCGLLNQDEENEPDAKKSLADPFLEKNIFINGSKYSGTWDAISMTGVGRFIFPHGTIFEGEFRDDKFHGHGNMSWPCGQNIDGVWTNGEIKMKRYKFKDGLEYAEEDWKYCRFPDRRFYACITDGLKPARQTLKTNCHPTKIIPFLSYDVGNGIYDPSTHCIMSYDSKKIIEIPTEARARWIVNNCRKGFNEPTGYRPCLNENWSGKLDRDFGISYCLPLSNDSPQRWWKRLSTFEQDTTIYRKDDYTCQNCYLHRERGEVQVQAQCHEDTRDGSYRN